MWEERNSSFPEKSTDLTRYSMVKSGSSENDAIRTMSISASRPAGERQRTRRSVTPFAMSSRRTLARTVPVNMLKGSPPSFTVMPCVSATLSMVCFSVARPQRFSACFISAKS